MKRLCYVDLSDYVPFMKSCIVASMTLQQPVHVSCRRELHYRAHLLCTKI